MVSVGTTGAGGLFQKSRLVYMAMAWKPGDRCVQGSELAHHHFYHIILVKETHKIQVVGK